MKKKSYFWPTFHIDFFSHQPGKSYKNSYSTYLTHIHTCILLTLLTSFALPILKKIRICQVWFLFGKSLGVVSYSRHFGTINKSQNGKQNLSWNVYCWYVFTLMPNLYSFVNRGLWMAEIVQKSQKHCFLAADIFAFHFAFHR